MTCRSTLLKSKLLYLVQISDYRIAIVCHEDLKLSSDKVLKVDNSLSVKYGQEYLDAKLLAQGKFIPTLHNNIHIHKLLLTYIRRHQHPQTVGE